MYSYLVAIMTLVELMDIMIMTLPPTRISKLMKNRKSLNSGLNDSKYIATVYNYKDT